METGEAPQAGRKVSTWLVPAIGYTISLASLWWAFARFPFAQMGDHLRTMGWGWLGLSVALELGSFFLDAWRWRELLRPAVAPPYGAAVQSVFAGLFANDVLPARAGEAVRCFLLSYKTDIHLPLVITSLVILRVMDGIWVVIFYFATSFAVEGAGRGYGRDGGLCRGGHGVGAHAAFVCVVPASSRAPFREKHQLGCAVRTPPRRNPQTRELAGTAHRDADAPVSTGCRRSVPCGQLRARTIFTSASGR